MYDPTHPSSPNPPPSTFFARRPLVVATLVALLASCSDLNHPTPAYTSSGGNSASSDSSGSGGASGASGGSSSAGTVASGGSSASSSGNATSAGATGQTNGGNAATADGTSGTDTGSVGATTAGTSSGSVGTGGGGTVGTTTAADAGINDRGPTPPANGSQFPFPQNRESHFCSYPTGYQNAAVRAAYQKWKTDTVTSDGANGFRRVKRPNDSGLETNSTVSEGIGYGMIIAVYMNDQALFDDLWKYEQQHLDGTTGLMNWYINAAGTDIGHNPDGNGPATDADEDMAWGLVMADRQWGGKGSLDKAYIDAAKDTIQHIWDHEIFDSKLIMPGPWGGGWSNVNPSYFAPAYYRVFAKVSGDTRWSTDVIKTVYDTITNALNTTNGNATNGLIPAWCTSDGVPNGNVLMSGNPTNYQYDACRTPFRIGLDYCLFGEMQAHDYVAKTSAFFSGIGAKNIVDGYNLDGGAAAQHPTGQSAAFVGPAAVGAMSAASYRSFLDDAYADLTGLNLLVGGVYYDESWTMMSLLMLTGNFLDYTAY